MTIAAATAAPDRGPAPGGARWLPSVSVAIWLALFLAMNLSPRRVAMISADGDPCWHWRQGAWMLEHRAVLRTDQFSHTRAGAPLVEMWWLSELVFAVAGQALGWGGIVLVSAALAATPIWLLHRQLLAEGTDQLAATSLALLAAAVGATHWLARPHLATLLLFGVFAWQLRWHTLGRVPGRRLLWLLPLLMVLWVNLHGAFVAGLVLVGLHFAGALPAAWRARRLTPPVRTLGVTLALCVLASLVNPNGWTLHAHIIEHLRNPVLARFAQEYTPPDFRRPDTWPFLLLVALSLALAVQGRARLTGTDALVWLAWLVLSLHMVRNAPLFALAATPLLAHLANAQLARVPAWHRLTARAGAFGSAAADGLYVAVASLALLGLLAVPRLLGGPAVLPTEIPADRYPVDAVAHLRAQPAAVAGPMFNDMNWGGYLLWALPERPVFIHANLDLYGPALVQEYNEVDEVRPGWAAVLDRHDVRWTLLPAAHPLNRVLQHEPGWEPLYADPVAKIFGRRHD